MIDAGDAMIASCETKHVNSFTRERALAVTEANARLIAAAPEMLAHIIRWTNVYHHTHERDAGREMDFMGCEAAGCVAARALLAKIEGK